MAEKAQRVSAFLEQNIPLAVRERLLPHLSLETMTHLEEDLPHRRAHILETLFMLKYVEEDLNLGAYQWYLALRTLDLHDRGYIFVNQGILQPEEHHYGSVLIASRMVSDIQILYAILHHIDDILPPNTPLWVRAIRDIDRTATAGYTGINRMVYYLGFRDFPFTSDSLLAADHLDEELIQARILCETEYCHIEEYEDPAREFFLEHVLPFLRKDEVKLRRAREMMEIIYARLIGDPLHSIEPIMMELRQEGGLSEKKMIHTRKIMDDLV